MFDVFNTIRLVSFTSILTVFFLHKIYELHYIAISSDAAVIGISETKLDNTIYDSKVAVDGYNLMPGDRK